MRRTMLILLIGCAVALSTACKNEENLREEYPYAVYYLAEDGTELVEKGCELTATSDEEKLRELLELLQTEPSDRKLTAPIYGNAKVAAVKLDGIEVTVDFSEYRYPDATRELFARAAIVRTLCQLDSVGSVTFTVNGTVPETPAGLAGMRNSSFVLDIHEPSDIRQVTLVFPKKGKTEMERVVRTVLYDDYNPLEVSVLESLFAGPTGEETGAIPFVPAGTRILSAESRNGICIVDLSRQFTENAAAGNVDGYRVIHAISETLFATFDDLDGVVITVEGKKLETYGNYTVPWILTSSEHPT